ncbi:MAG TPA: helicase-associated domain-containing protein, partial [Ktedonobacteraceae bacterium]|nr:helicase-associated domain-containing protein [Ktedonobacteraceae bacterium]
KWLCVTKEGKVSMQEVRKHAGYDDSTISATLHNLEDIAVAFDALTEQGRMLFVPNDVAGIFKKALEHPEAVAVQPGLQKLTSPPLTVHTSDTLIPYDLAIIIGAAYQQDLEPTQAGRVPKRLAAKIQPLLHGKPRRRYVDSDDDYMEMLFDIAQGLGLLQLSQSALQEMKPHYEPGIHLAQWAKQNRVEQVKQLLKHWQEKMGWIDLIAPNYVDWDSYLWRPMMARSLILNYLRRCIAGQWYSTASLLETIWDEDPLALRPPQYGYYHGFGPASGSSKPKKPAGSTIRAKWMNAEGAVYTGMLASVLYELGIVSIGYQVPSTVVDAGQVFNPDAFMLTELGAAVLTEKTASTPAGVASVPSERLLVVQPSFEVLLLHPDMPTLYSLLPFVQINQVEVVSRFTLTRASVLRGLRTGLTVDSMLEILQKQSQREIAQNVEYTLRDWARLYKGARISQPILLEVSDEALANEICASTKLQAFRLRRLGPCAIAAQGDINSLRRTLDKEGIAVTVS